MQLTYLPLLLLLLFFLSAATDSDAVYSSYTDCTPVPYICGDANFNIAYPFRIDNRPNYCGYPNFYLNCTDNSTNSLTLTISNNSYHVTSIDYDNNLVNLVDTAFMHQTCPQPYKNTTIDTSLFRISDRCKNVTLFVSCTATSSSIPYIYDTMCFLSGTGGHSYYRLNNDTMDDLLGTCSSIVTVPMDQDAATRMVNRELGLGAALQQGFSVEWVPGTGWCGGCISSGGVCGYNSTSPADHTCYCANGTFVGSCYGKGGRGSKSSGSWKIALGTLVAVAGILVVCVFCLLRRRRKSAHHPPSSTLLVQNSSFAPSSKKELGSACVSFHCDAHLFSYQELEEATKGFDPAQELGDGGYGTVYKGVLGDSRVVAVKRLYETNGRRVEQFINEVELLSRLRHPNLVALYGCTSPKSPHLLLVYEFVANGTLADHLHDPLRSRSLPISLRLNMAIEIASALSYLHSNDIIHRDVKTVNILVDENHDVKVADFGLSRLFPANATHISTAPQGTPGYLDPEYHRYYQLTDKSDVYSYGVVLAEILASRPAVDVGRHPKEISLAMVAINKIQKGELDFVDPALMRERDRDVDRVVAQIAELAFRCLQMEREMRPTMKEVLEELREISRTLSCGGPESDVKVCDDVGLLAGSAPFSPISVNGEWSSRSTTPNTSK